MPGGQVAGGERDVVVGGDADAAGRKPRGRAADLMMADFTSLDAPSGTTLPTVAGLFIMRVE
ncbi:MAG: hypothetical protein ABSA53_23140 [Streptosporangiaceae bacterium]